jgi:glycosyltransferase involved in cell wall biosynthesis
MKKIIFIANVDNGQGMSGGSRIYFEFLKNWDNFFATFFWGSLGTIKRLQKENIKNITFIEVDDGDKSNLYSIYGVFLHFFRRLIKGMFAVIKNTKIIKQAEYVYSTSDFYPDFIPAWYIKFKNPRIKWIAGYYLFAPSPFSKESPYKGENRLRGFLYWLMQRPSHFIVKHWADFVLVTSEPDVKKFITKKRDSNKIIVVQGGVDITESEKYLESGNIIPLDKRKYDACFVGRFHYQKGVVVLADIWRKVCEKKKNAKLVMIGADSSDNPIENAVKEKIKQYGLENNIDILGFRDGQEKYEIFKQAKIIVHPATYDSGGMAAAEGMAWGLPGVSFDLEALKTYYPKGMIKTKLGDKDEFAKNILSLLDDKDFYEETANEAHSLIVEVWDWSKRANNILSLIKI